MEAWQLLQGNIPSVIGGGETGNSSYATIGKGDEIEYTEEENKDPDRASFSMCIIFLEWREKRGNPAI